MNCDNDLSHDMDINQTELNAQKDILYITQFELDAPNKKRTQQLFHSVLFSLIKEYNELGPEKSAKKGIYYLKERHILLGNIKEDYIQEYLKFKELFDDLMAGKSKFYPEFDENKSNSSCLLSNDDYNDKKSWNSYKTQNYRKKVSFNSFNEGKMTSGFFQKKKKKSGANKKIIYNLTKISSFFNGMYFESIATETFFKLIDENYGDEGNHKEIISFLPRIIFYMNDKKEKDNGKDYYGYNEIDCSFKLQEKDKVELKKEMITCFKSFEAKEESKFFKLDNVKKNITINKDDIVIMEVKSSWQTLTTSNKKIKSENDEVVDNKLEKFIKKAKLFVEIYEELGLVKKNQKKKLIYLYDNSMLFDIGRESSEILKAHELIKNDKLFELYISYFQPYLKMLNSYERVKKLRTLNQTIKKQEQNQKNLEFKVNSLEKKIEIIFLVFIFILIFLVIVYIINNKNDGKIK